MPKLRAVAATILALAAVAAVRIVFPPVVEVVSVPLAHAADGAAVYKAQCVKCHGETGKADTAAGKALKVPSLLGDANVKKMSAAEVAARIKTNEKHPPTIKDLDGADIEAAAAYAKQLASQ